MRGACARLLALVLAAGLGLAACAAGQAVAPLDPVEAPRRAWLPETPARAVVLAVHGFNDYSNAFAGFGAFAAAHGIAVHAYDQRGFGANPDAGQWPGTAVLVEQFEHELARTKQRHPDLPVYVLGESMGAAVIMVAAAEHGPKGVAGMILAAPAVWGLDELNPLYRATLWLAVRLVPGLRLTGENLGIQASDNIPMLRELGADPLVIKATRVAAIAGLVSLMDRALGDAGSVPGPLLVLGGVHDQIIPPDAYRDMLARLSASPCSEITYPEGYHMLLRDLQREVVWRDILAWIDGEPPPSGQARPCGGALTRANLESRAPRSGGEASPAF